LIVDISFVAISVVILLSDIRKHTAWSCGRSCKPAWA